MNPYTVLDSPLIFRISQAMFAPGADHFLTSLTKDLLKEVDPGASLLEVGCGPKSWLWAVGLEPMGSDLSERYVRAYSDHGRRLAVANSADALPFASHSFDSVWSLALLHHLPDAVARTTLNEMVRVCRRGGYVVVIDAVMPRSVWMRPLAYAIRRLDRGQWVRDEVSFRRLFLGTSFLPEKVRRATTTYNGLEALVIWTRVPLTPDKES